MVGENGLEEVHTAEAVAATQIAAPAPKMNTNNKVVDQQRQAKKQKMLIGKRKHAVVHKPTVVEKQEKLPTPRYAHKNFEGSSCCLTTPGTKNNNINHEAQSYTLYSEHTKFTSITGSCDKRRRLDDYIVR